MCNVLPWGRASPTQICILESSKPCKSMAANVFKDVGLLIVENQSWWANFSFSTRVKTSNSWWLVDQAINRNNPGHTMLFYVRQELDNFLIQKKQRSIFEMVDVTRMNAPTNWPTSFCQKRHLLFCGGIDPSRFFIGYLAISSNRPLVSDVKFNITLWLVNLPPVTYPPEIGV